MNSEVLIIGGGVIGLSIARELHKKGAAQITIIEKGEVGREASFAAAGILAPQAEADSVNDFFRFCSESRSLYPKFTDELFDETGIDIELDQSGTLYLAFSEQDSRELRQRFEWQNNAGLAVEHLSAEETRKVESFISPKVCESLFFPNDWQVENRKLLEALKKYVEINGIRICEHTEISKVTFNGDCLTAMPAKAVAPNIFADTVILATGAWTSLIKVGETAVPVNVKPIRGQMIAFNPPERIFQKIIYSPRGYLVPRADNRILIGATVEDAGFDKSTTESGEATLRETAYEITPTLANFEVSESWAGLRPFAADGLPVLGEIPGFDNLFIATAHYRNGILLAPLTAKIISGKIVDDVSSDYFQTFGLARFRATAKL